MKRSEFLGIGFRGTKVSQKGHATVFDCLYLLGAKDVIFPTSGF